MDLPSQGGGERARPSSGHPYQMGHLGISTGCPVQRLNPGWPECQAPVQRTGPALGHQGGQGRQVCQETLGAPEVASTAAPFSLFLRSA